MIKDSVSHDIHTGEMSKLPHRQGVQVYIINDNDELLLVSNVGDDGSWKVPSGGMEHGELAEDTARREMKEELGVEIEILHKCSFRNKYYWQLHTIHKSGLKYRGQEQDIFIAIIPDGQKIIIDPSEIRDYKWVGFKDLGNVLTLELQRENARKVLEEYKAHCPR